MTTRNSTATSEEQKTLELERTFNLPLTTVWKAFSDPTAFKQWWGPKEYTCPDCIIDFKVGGKFVASMQGEDGKKIWAVGKYKEIVPLKKIVLAAVLSVRKLYCTWLMALNDVFDS